MFDVSVKWNESLLKFGKVLKIFDLQHHFFVWTSHWFSLRCNYLAKLLEDSSSHLSHKINGLNNKVFETLPYFLKKLNTEIFVNTLKQFCCQILIKFLRAWSSLIQQVAIVDQYVRRICMQHTTYHAHKFSIKYANFYSAENRIFNSK